MKTTLLVTFLTLSLPGVAHATALGDPPLPADSAGSPAQTQASDDQGPKASINAVLGMGPGRGNTPAAMELTVQGQYWLSRTFGVGGRTGFVHFGDWLWPDHEVDGFILEPNLFARVGARSVTGYFGVGVGLAQTDEQVCAPDDDQWFSCGSWTHDSAAAMSASASAAVLFHPWSRGFTFGPQGRLQTIGRDTLGATVGAAVGASF